MKSWIAAFGSLALLVFTASADEPEPIFSPGDHCVAYRTVKDMLFAKNVPIVGLSCEVKARIVSPDDPAGPRVAIEVPIKSFDSGNLLRNYSVSDILGAGSQPDLLFASDPLDVEALRENLAGSGSGFEVRGQLTIAGVEHEVSSRVEISEFEGRRFVRGRFSTTFADLGMEAPRAGVGLIAEVHEELDLLAHIDLTRVEGLSDLLEARPPATPR